MIICKSSVFRVQALIPEPMSSGSPKGKSWNVLRVSNLQIINPLHAPLEGWGLPWLFSSFRTTDIPD